MKTQVMKKAWEIRKNTSYNMEIKKVKIAEDQMSEQIMIYSYRKIDPRTGEFEIQAFSTETLKISRKIGFEQTTYWTRPSTGLKETIVCESHKDCSQEELRELFENL